MAVFESISESLEYRRELVNSSNLNLGFDLGKDFCAAAYHAVAPLADILLAQQGIHSGVYKNPAQPYERFSIYLTPPVLEVLSTVASAALNRECARIGQEYPKILFTQANMNRLVAGCLTHNSRAAAVVCAPSVP